MSSLFDGCKRLFGELCVILAYGVIGALVAGVYGIFHDQVTFTISREYFTDFKFHQFAWAAPGFPERIFVGEIGFLATWWLGAFAALVLATIAIYRWGRPVRAGRIFTGIAVIVGCAFGGGVTGGILGYFRRSDPNFDNWQDYVTMNGVHDLPAFVNVGYIHNAGYLGAVIGLVLAVCLMAWPGKSA